VLERPEIVHSPAQATAVIRIQVPRTEIQRVMEPAIGEVLQVLREQGVQPGGPLVAHHRSLDPAVFDFEIGFPVTMTVRPSRRVVPSSIPAATVVRAIYRGGYEGLGNAWKELSEWLKAQGREAGPNLWERYLSGPESGPDTSRWRTELNRPLVEGD
jgi:effector-binding domain-containing protein